jgi:uncharacterized membrane protein YuzA (DUF378 family)
MHFLSKRSFLRGGLYHFSLILVASSALNWGFHTLTGVDLAARLFAGINIPREGTAMALCAAAVMVLWNNWVD